MSSVWYSIPTHHLLSINYNWPCKVMSQVYCPNTKLVSIKASQCDLKTVNQHGNTVHANLIFQRQDLMKDSI